MKYSLVKRLIVLMGIVLLTFSFIMRNKVVEKSVPKHLVGPSGLEDIRHYLVLYLLLSFLCMVLGAVVFFFILILTADKKSESKTKSNISMAVLAILAGGFTSVFNSLNNFDLHAQKMNYSKYGIFKSISMLSDINADLKNGEYYETELSGVRPSDERYHYFSGKRGHTKIEPAIVDSSGSILAQIGTEDTAPLEAAINKNGGTVKFEFYKESGFIKSVAGIEDIASFQYTEEDRTIVIHRNE